MMVWVRIQECFLVVLCHAHGFVAKARLLWAVSMSASNAETWLAFSVLSSLSSSPLCLVMLLLVSYVRQRGSLTVYAEVDE